jgi:DNA-binding transcriptional MocR family regulator
MQSNNIKSPFIRLRIERSESHSFTRLDIVKAVRREFDSGCLPVGSRMPPVRVLQHQLGVAKNTIQTAYEELVAQGILENRARLGYFALALSKKRTVAQPMTPATPVLLKVPTVPAPRVSRVSRGRASQLPIRLGSAFIDNDLLPSERVAECFRAVLKRGIPMDYDAQGFTPLRALIAQRLEKRGIPARADDVIVTTGSQQALDVVTRALQKRSIATENPAYGIGKQLFEMNQMDVTGLPLNPFDGIDMKVWRKLLALNRPSMLYITTNFHNPTGYSYSTAELMQLIELSRELQCGLVEDDWGSDMLSYSEFRPALRALGGENVLYMNSFTKKVIPSLRIGYLVANEATRNSLLAAKRVATLANPTIVEAVVFEFVERGYYDTHLRRLQAELDTRYRKCLEALAELMPEGVRWTTPGGGPVLWLELPRRADLNALTERLKKQNVLLDGRLNEWFFGEPHLHGTRINYAQESVERTRQGLELLAKELRTTLV